MTFTRVDRVIESAMKRLTLRGLYAFFAIGTVGWIAAWVLFESTNWVNTWAPNLAAEFAGAFVTVAVVQFIVERQQRPLREFAGKRIEHSILALLQTPMTYRTRLAGNVPETPDPQKMLDDWRDELAQQLPEWDWLAYWGKYLASTEPFLSTVRDRYDRVLPERLLTALDDFALWASRSANDISWSHTLDGIRDGNKYPTAEWAKVSIADHFTTAITKLNELLDAFEEAIGRPLLLTEEMWRAARAHRRAQVAGPPLTA